MDARNSPLKLVMPWNKLWGGTWKRRNIFNGKWFILEMFLFGAIFIAIPYFLSNNIASIYLEDTFKMFPENRYDRSIPVINWMIVPYTVLYLFYPTTLILAPKNDKGRMELITAMQMLIMANIFCVVFFLLFPAEIDMRDAIDWNSMNNLELLFFEFIHTSDRPWNAWPSLHIVHSYFLARLMTHWVKNNYSENKFANIFLGVLWIEWFLLCISILTTKQHYMFDLFSGGIVGIIVWKLYQPVLEKISVRGAKKLANDAGWV